jgi:hypothetical protein
MRNTYSNPRAFQEFEMVALRWTEDETGMGRLGWGAAEREGAAEPVEAIGYR